MSRHQKADIERWFVRRGVPQLIEGYTTEQRMDLRAAPYIVVWLVLGTLAWWGTRPDWSPSANAIGSAATLVGVFGGLTVARWLQGRRPWPLAPELRPLDVAVIGLLAGTAAGVVDGSVREMIVATLNSLLGIGLIYVVVGFGLVEIAAWGIGRLVGEAINIAALLARTLPLLLILVLFVLFASEIWEAAQALSLTELGTVLALIGLVAVVLIVSASSPHITEILSASPETLVGHAQGTPAGLLTFPDDVRVPPLNWLQRANVTVLIVVAQLIQSIFVALLVAAFLVAFGILALPEAVQEHWSGSPISPLARFELLGEERVVSRELATVATMLGSVVGLYFTGLAVTDASFRRAHFGRIVAEARQLLSAWALYVAALGSAEQRSASSHPA